MTRIGQVVKSSNHEKKLTFVYDKNITKELRKDNRGRVYALCVNGEIVKIGGSQAKGGIDGTYSAYFGGFAPKMSLRTYCVWNFMRQDRKSTRLNSSH